MNEAELKSQIAKGEVQEVKAPEPNPETDLVSAVQALQQQMRDYSPWIEKWRIGSRNPSFTVSAARAYIGTIFTVPNGPVVKVEYDSKSFDALNEFDEATNHRFTAQSAGKYLIHANVEINSLGLGESLFAYIYKNGVEYSQTRFIDSLSGGDVRAPITDILDLEAGDYIEIFVDATPAADTFMQDGEGINWVLFHKLS